MKVTLFGFEFRVRRVSGLVALRAQEVDRIAKQQPRYGISYTATTIARCKAVRQLRPDVTLADAKRWVEAQRWE